ncbi:MAG: adenosylcobinamide-GDP ribazoletransferase [Paracoccaceae bacterium]
MDLKAWARAELPAFLLALQFLTRLRLPVEVDYAPAAMRDSPRWYPAVGVVVGILTGVLYWASAGLFTPVLAALIAVAAGVILTGALHEDGFADACDGLGGTQPRERVLEIMRDSRIGTYGVLGLGLMIAGKVATLSALPVGAVPFVLIAGHTASRMSMLWVMASSDYVRDQGAGSGVSGGVDQPTMVTALVVTGLALVPVLFVVPVMALLMGLAGLAAGHFAMRRRFEARLGGYTGDCLGAVQQCSEIGFYLGVLAWVHP